MIARRGRPGSCRRNVLRLAVLSMLIAGASEAHAASGTPLSTASPLLESYAKQAKDQSQPESQRLLMVALLGTWATDEVRPPLVELLGDPSPAIRLAAARALAWPGNRAAGPALRERVVAPGEVSGVRLAAIEALGRVGDEASREAVLAATRDPDAAIRGAAFRALTLETLTSPTDRIALLRQMAGDKGLDPVLRCQAIQALGSAKDSGSAELLLRLLEHEPSSAMPVPTPTASERETMAIRYRQIRDVKAWAALALYMVDAKEAIPLLLTTADDPRDYFLRLVSVQALAGWKVPQAVPVLVKRLDDPFDQTRVAALWALAAIGDRSAVDPVLARLSDKAAEVRVQAVDTLAALGDPRVRPELESLRDRERDARVHEALEKALAKLGP